MTAIDQRLPQSEMPHIDLNQRWKSDPLLLFPMAWAIHILRGDLRFRHEAHDLSTAMTVACLLLNDGLEVEAIEGPDGTRIEAQVIRALSGPSD